MRGLPSDKPRNLHGHAIFSIWGDALTGAHVVKVGLQLGAREELPRALEHEIHTQRAPVQLHSEGANRRQSRRAQHRLAGKPQVTDTHAGV